jgi:hypothetical protein
LWFDEINLKEWQDNFESVELLEGTKNYEGSKNMLIYNKGEMILEETILLYKYPLEKRTL